MHTPTIQYCSLQFHSGLASLYGVCMYVYGMLTLQYRAAVNFDRKGAKTCRHLRLITMHVISQIDAGYVRNRTVGYVSAFHHYPCHDCGNLINSVYYKEYLQHDQGSTSVLQQVSKIVSSSTEFQQVAGGACARFSAKWAFEVTWIDVGDRYAFRSLNTVSIVYIVYMYSNTNLSFACNVCMYNKLFYI